MSARLVIPRPSLVVLCGPAGSGKSTFARRHFPATAIVSSDRCRAMIGDDEANIRVSPQAFELFHFIIELRLRDRRLTVADSTALRAEARRDLEGIAKRYGVPAVLIVFNVSEARALAHNTRRKRRVARPVIEQQWERLQEALQTVHEEGFDRVYILGEDEVGGATIELTPAAGARAATRPPWKRPPRDGRG
ncbi:MAG: AAA family ATPase [Armatimonadetes bacterium]|nr:AAA family ATPase [Armatimonadota bacterium]